MGFFGLPAKTTMPLSWRCALRTDFETMERRGSIVNVDVLTTNQCSAPSAIAMIGQCRAPLDDVLSGGSGPCRPRTRQNAMSGKKCANQRPATCFGLFGKNPDLPFASAPTPARPRPRTNQIESHLIGPRYANEPSGIAAIDAL